MKTYMTSKTALKAASIAIVGASLLGPVLTHAADTTNAARMSERDYNKAWSGEKERLEQALKAGQGRASYAKTLNDSGFTITSVNVDKPDYLEYEVVKANHSYEVQINLDSAAKAKSVDVTSNLWRADATKAAMHGGKVPAATAYVQGGERYSDRSRMKAWSGEKEMIEKSLGAGKDRAAYESELKKMGYQITSVNESDKDHVEYEVVKGDHSYEVQIDLAAGMGKKVDVTTNMWQSEATEKALGKK
jgi:hypothetical protein